jgi:Plasmid pRiA4b ORF-3-like protein
MKQESDKLKLGKGASFFVKSQLKRLRQEDETWEADFFPIPCSDSEHGSLWWGIVLSHSHENVLAQRMVEEPSNVNDLANLLAEAMRRPLVDFSHRPRSCYLRARPEWAELLPHLKQVGIEVVSQEALPMWDQAFGDLHAKVEQARAPRKEKPMARSKKPAAKAAKPDDVQLYTLDVFIISGPVSEKFAKKYPVVCRTIQIRGHQTLEDLHDAIFAALGRWEQHMYEFQFGRKPMDPKARRYVLPHALEIQQGQPNPPIGRVDETTIESLRLKVGDRFGYWFDFGDDWWHQINVEAIEEKIPRGKFPKVTKKVGKSLPQYADENE